MPLKVNQSEHYFRYADFSTNRFLNESANLHRLRRLVRAMKWAGRLPVPYLRTGHRILGQEFSTREELLDLWKIRGENQVQGSISHFAHVRC
jgi:hypothetical protein